MDFFLICLVPFVLAFLVYVAYTLYSALAGGRRCPRPAQTAGDVVVRSPRHSAANGDDDGGAPDNSGVVEFAVVLHHRLDGAAVAAGEWREETTRRREVREVREVGETREVGEEEALLRACAVTGVVAREEERLVTAVRPRGGVIYRVPGESLTPTPVVLSHSVSHASLPSNPPHRDGSVAGFSRPLTPEIEREGTGTIVRSNSDVGPTPQQSAGRVRSDSLDVYGHALYVDREDANALGPADSDRPFAAASAHVADNSLWPQDDCDASGRCARAAAFISAGETRAPFGGTPSAESPTVMGEHNAPRARNRSSTDDGNGDSDVADGLCGEVFGCSPGVGAVVFSNDEAENMSCHPPIGASASTAAPIAGSAFTARGGILSCGQSPACGRVDVLHPRDTTTVILSENENNSFDSNMNVRKSVIT